MAAQKTFSTFDEQIKHLKDEKHLVISNENYTKDILMRIGYFPLFGGYKHLFRIPLTKKYKEGDFLCRFAYVVIALFKTNRLKFMPI